MSSRLAFSLKPLWYIPKRAVGILIHPAGGYGRLAGQHGTASNGIDRSIRGIRFPYDLLVVISANLTTLLNLLWYILSHVSPTLLILQVSQTETRKTKIVHEPRATFENIKDSLRLIYQAQSPYTFFRAFSIGLFQFLLTGAVAELLQWVIFLEAETLRPFAYAISSALLCELHLVFTCAIVSAEPVPFRSLLREPGQNRWKHLAIPAFWYGFLSSWMEILYDIAAVAVADILTPLEERNDIGTWVAAAVLIAIIMLAFHLLVFIPTYIKLTLAEVRFLPANTQTIGISSSKDRLRIWELVGDQKPLAPLGTSSNPLKPSRMGISRQLIMLHLKKASVYLVFEIAFYLTVYVALLMGLFD